MATTNLEEGQAYKKLLATAEQFEEYNNKKAQKKWYDSHYQDGDKVPPPGTYKGDGPEFDNWWKENRTFNEPKEKLKPWLTNSYLLLSRALRLTTYSRL
jgi:hypothetical protein